MSADFHPRVVGLPVQREAASHRERLVAVPRAEVGAAGRVASPGWRACAKEGEWTVNRQRPR